MPSFSVVVRVWNKSWVGWRPSSTSCSSAISSKLATSIVLVLGASHVDLREFIYSGEVACASEALGMEFGGSEMDGIDG
jgi:hypothetical protein